MELSNGVSIPAIGLGVYKMQAGSEMNAAVKAAYRAGYRLFDTAQMYGNEAALGEALRDAGIPREDVFLISKINNDSQWYAPALASIRETLRKMQTPYLDSFLIHWPGQNPERTLDTWRALETAYREGLVRSIRAMAWAPLLRGRFGEDIPRIAEKYGKTPAQILLRWNIQQGIIPIPKSKNPARLAENIDVFDFELAEEDMTALNVMNCGKRTSHDPLTFGF